ASVEAFRIWRDVPAPKRGELVRLLGDELRAHKDALGRLVTVENGKILQEGLGEVQEMIDICDFAVGLSRQLYGLTIASERPGHRMMETWHPAGPVGVISAFNFPVAVWAWNAALALVCGDPVIWKPSAKTPLAALAVQALFARAAKKFGDAPAALSQLALCTREAGELLTKDPRIPVVSATGSTAMGKIIGPTVAARFGRSILELGGNNAMIVCPSAKLELAERAILFAAVGTAGQRCTSLRRLIVHESVYDTLLARLKTHYGKLVIGDPLAKGTLVGPLIDGTAFEAMQQALAAARAEGGKITGGGRALQAEYPNAYYAHPAIVEMPAQTAIVCHETFAPILYVMRYRKFDEALALHNEVPQGLSSCIFTRDMQEAEKFLAASGSDCGIANVNIGPSGAEIGGAFGGEKETGGGRESGSDSWKAYMRRQTATINYSDALPLAQGIEFGGG
ncbi:MAG: aldehyde dehydrogenase family protein, partial [Alphaproteobacteria bacterium]|nr:aldehyde dehydrogenase family protein [Alphaproteobacteria bacterium]